MTESHISILMTCVHYCMTVIKKKKIFLKNGIRSEDWGKPPPQTIFTIMNILYDYLTGSWNELHVVEIIIKAFILMIVLLWLLTCLTGHFSWMCLIQTAMTLKQVGL